MSHAEQVRRLIDGGATLIQLREKNGAPKDFLRDAEEALAIAKRNNVRVIINDRVDIAMALRADGVHLGQTDMPIEPARKLLGTQSIIGYSTHNLAQVADAVTLPIDYLACGAIFDTTTKLDHGPTVGLTQLRQIKDEVPDKPLVAIGGITHQNFLDALSSGADSVAIIFDLLREPTKISEKLARMLALIGE